MRVDETKRCEERAAGKDNMRLMLTTRMVAVQPQKPVMHTNNAHAEAGQGHAHGGGPRVVPAPAPRMEEMRPWWQRRMT